MQYAWPLHEAAAAAKIVAALPVPLDDRPLPVVDLEAPGRPHRLYRLPAGRNSSIRRILRALSRLTGCKFYAYLHNFYFKRRGDFWCDSPAGLQNFARVFKHAEHIFVMKRRHVAGAAAKSRPEAQNRRRWCMEFNELPRVDAAAPGRLADAAALFTA